MAIHSQNMQFIWTSGTAAVTTSMDSTGAVGEVINISGPTGSAGVLDISHLGSTAKEKMMGLPDEGQVSLEVLYGYGTSLNDKMKDIVADRKARTKRRWGIIFPDAATSFCHADGYVTGFSVSGGVDQPVKANITIEIDGAITWAS